MFLEIEFKGLTYLTNHLLVSLSCSYPSVSHYKIKTFSDMPPKHEKDQGNGSKLFRPTNIASIELFFFLAGSNSL